MLQPWCHHCVLFTAFLEAKFTSAKFTEEYIITAMEELSLNSQETSPYLLEILRHIAINLDGLCRLVLMEDKFPVIEKTMTISVTGPYRQNWITWFNFTVWLWADGWTSWPPEVPSSPFKILLWLWPIFSSLDWVKWFKFKSKIVFQLKWDTWK